MITGPLHKPFLLPVPFPQMFTQCPSLADSLPSSHSALCLPASSGELIRVCTSQCILFAHLISVSHPGL